MKKYFKIILPFLIVSSLCSCGTNNVNNNIKNAIDKTNNYLNNNEIDNNMFSYYLQDILPSSLVYSLDDNSYLIHYKNKSFVYQNNKLEEKATKVSIMLIIMRKLSLFLMVLWSIPKDFQKQMMVVMLV